MACGDYRSKTYGVIYMAAYGDLMSIKERLGTMAVSTDDADLDLTNKLDDASDFIVLKLEEFPTVFPTPSALTGSDKVRLDRIVADLACALYLEDRSQRVRANLSPDTERWSTIFRRRAMMELEQFIRVKTKAADLGDSPDIVKIQGTKLGER